MLSKPHMSEHNYVPQNYFYVAELYLYGFQYIMHGNYYFLISKLLICHIT